MDTLERLLGHDRWATLRAIDLSAGLTDEQLDQQIDVGVQSLRRTFGHIVGAIDFWMGNMTGVHPSDDNDAKLSVSALSTEFDRAHSAFATFALKTRDEGRLEETFADHNDVHHTLGITFCHLIMHDAQHRTEARHILERFGIADDFDGDPQEWEWLLHQS